jgi:AraC-like DNA-binding protein/anti-sigma28 factor (negative regulator of flagellin synthesis)
MKPSAAIIAPESIFYIREIKSPHFSGEFHFHEECQLAYIIKGSGKRVVGDSVENFEEDEMVFIGANVPHVWYNISETSAKKTESSSVSISLFISPEKLLSHLGAIGDTQKIEQLFQKAERGMYITGASKKKLAGLLLNAAKENGIQYNITLLTIVQLLSTTEEYRLLAASDYTNNFQHKENERMNDVYRYLIKNYTREISLNKVAAVAAMNPNAFCRFFKTHTQKSLIQFINEIRIGQACKLLNNKNLSITQIAYQCGYNNVSNFNRFFKIVKKTSPREYRKQLS